MYKNIIIECSLPPNLNREELIAIAKRFSELSEYDHIGCGYGQNQSWHDEKFSSFEDFEMKEPEMEYVVSFEFNSPESHILIQYSQNTKRIYTPLTDYSLIDVILNNFREVINCAFVHNKVDYTLSHSTKGSYWEKELGRIPSYLAKSIDPGYKWFGGEKWKIDLETAPTHRHKYKGDEGLLFSSCWQMYFSSIYYKYIPKPLWEDFSDCEENIILPNGLRKITLYSNPDDFDKEESRRRQWAFRHQLGIDSIAHELCRKRSIEEENKLPVRITKKECKKGQTRVFRFLDGQGKLAQNSSKAKSIEIKEYLDDGITVVLEENIFI